MPVEEEAMQSKAQKTADAIAGHWRHLSLHDSTVFSSSLILRSLVPLSPLAAAAVDHN